MEANEGSFEKSFEETELVRVTFLFAFCFKEDSILSTNNGKIILRQDDISR